MLIEPTEEKLQAMRLSAMLEELRRQQQAPQFAKLSYEERMGFLVDAEYVFRENRRLTRRLGEAKLRYPAACLEAIEYSAQRKLDRAQMRQLGTCRWIEEQLHVIITGATGVGKSLGRLCTGAASVPTRISRHVPPCAAALHRAHPGTSGRNAAEAAGPLCPAGRPGAGRPWAGAAA